jgi:hypothetical protein
LFIKLFADEVEIGEPEVSCPGDPFGIVVVGHKLAIDEDCCTGVLAAESSSGRGRDIKDCVFAKLLVLEGFKTSEGACSILDRMLYSRFAVSDPNP